MLDANPTRTPRHPFAMMIGRDPYARCNAKRDSDTPVIGQAPMANIGPPNYPHLGLT